MKITYRLSLRQRKEFLVRGVLIRIAIPCPPGEINDPLRFARESLSEEMGEHVVHAEEAELRVSPSHGAAGLTGLLGTIGDTGGWTVGVAVVAVVVATLRAGKRNASAPKIQWPADVLIDGVSLVDAKAQKSTPDTNSRVESASE